MDAFGPFKGGLSPYLTLSRYSLSSKLFPGTTRTTIRVSSIGADVKKTVVNRMGPDHGLPLPPGYEDDQTYINDLLDFVTSTELLQTLVGGVHILDFFVNTPDLYERIIDANWRTWFDHVSIDDFIEFCLREDVDRLIENPDISHWRQMPRPPTSFIAYISRVRKLTLNRSHENRGPFEQMPRNIGLGMNVKKVHEVDQFARYLQRLMTDISASRQQDITKLVDFGAGQGYLGRFLASNPWNRHVVALEGKAHNVENAAKLDMHARLRKKSGIRVNKKELRATIQAELDANGGKKKPKPRTADQVPQPMRIARSNNDLPAKDPVFVAVERPEEGSGSVQHVEYRLDDGDLTSVISGLEKAPRPMDAIEASHDLSNGLQNLSVDVEDPQSSQESLLVMSLHSCGQLSHHALRSLVLNPQVDAVAVVGCCYNLMTERLSAPTYKMPGLRPVADPSILEPPEAEGDPHGFPMSERLCKYETSEGRGLQLPITARMMAVQAPANWSPDDCDDFFTRHFYRSLLQRVFLDLELVEPPIPRESLNGEWMMIGGRSPAGGGGTTQPVIIGKLGRKAYQTFPIYARAAVQKFEQNDERGKRFREGMDSLKDTDLDKYARDFEPRKKQLSMVWTLMAFSAQLIEATVIVDRFLWLKEQEQVAQCWVEPVFDYAESPRNLVVVGIKK